MRLVMGFPVFSFFLPPHPMIKGTRVLGRPHLTWGAEGSHTDEYVMSCLEAQSRTHNKNSRVCV